MPKQLELGRVGWVSRRHRGGRKPGTNPRIRHRSREPSVGRFPCHVTLKVRDGLPSLRTVRLVQELERSFARGCERGEFRLVHYSLQGNHAHLIVEAKDRAALGRGMKAIGSRLARGVNRVFKRAGPVLADRYHVHVLKTAREVRNALAYVLLNARHHAAKTGRVLSRSLGIDPASSGRWFDGWREASARFAATGLSPPVAVSPPRNWLLSIGWRHWELLDLAEIPGTRRSATWGASQTTAQVG